MSSFCEIVKKMDKNKILLAGGAGYIGSHTFVALVEAGFTPLILDDFSNSSSLVLTRLQSLTNQPVIYQQGSVADVALVKSLIEMHNVRAVIHFAAFK